MTVATPATTANPFTPTDGRRAPFGWPVIRILPGEEVPLSLLPPAPPAPRGGWLRFTVSVDDREEKLLAVRIPGEDTLLGIVDLRYCHSLEPFQLHLDAGSYARVAREGVLITLSAATSPLWLLDCAIPPDALPLAPQLIPDHPSAGGNALSADTTRAFFQTLGSLASVQTFSWMEGCVLDALFDLHEASPDASRLRAFDAHLALFIKPDGRLVYENPRGQPSDNRIYGIEGTLPFAQLAKRSPKHPLLYLAITFFLEKFRDDGSFTDHEPVTAEGSYTVAYPLAVIAQNRRDADLARISANILRIRRASLHRPEGIWLRYHADGSRTFRSWARGVAWYLLGLARSIEHLEGLTDLADLKADFRTAAAWVLRYQRPDGLWGCFIDDPATLADTSGSAGIAAALARGVRSGLLPGTALLDAAHRTWDGLLPHLTPDGILSGAAQANRAGESLQRGPYRVLSPMGMGLMGQLAGALKITP